MNDNLLGRIYCYKIYWRVATLVPILAFFGANRGKHLSLWHLDQINQISWTSLDSAWQLSSVSPNMSCLVWINSSIFLEVRTRASYGFPDLSSFWHSKQSWDMRRGQAGLCMCVCVCVWVSARMCAHFWMSVLENKTVKERDEGAGISLVASTLPKLVISMCSVHIICLCAPVHKRLHTRESCQWLAISEWQSRRASHIKLLNKG